MKGSIQFIGQEVLHESSLSSDITAAELAALEHYSAAISFGTTSFERITGLLGRFGSPTADAYSGTLYGGSRAALAKIASLLGKLEAMNAPPEKHKNEFLHLLSKMAGEALYHDLEIGMRTVRLLERWNCENELSSLIKDDYDFGFVSAIRENFAQVIRSLMRIAKSEASLNMLEQIKNDAASDSGPFNSIGSPFIVCDPTLDAFETAKTKWNNESRSRRLDISLVLTQQDVDQLTRQKELETRDYYVFIEGGQLHIRNMREQKIRLAIAACFKEVKKETPVATPPQSKQLIARR